MKYVSLHHHTTFSYGDGFGKPEAHFARAAELGMSALATTEHGNSSSHVQAEKAGDKYGVKSIPGLEAYTAPDNMREQLVWNEDGSPALTPKGAQRRGNQRKWHLTVLASDQPGLSSLNRIVTRSWNEGHYRWPTVTGSILRDHTEGLIVLSGCADSLLACTLLGGKNIPKPSKPNFDGALKVVRNFKALFGDRYYLECQQFPELERTRTLNPVYAELSRRTGVPLVASSDCHYPYPDDNEMQKILHAASRNTGTVAAAEAEWEYDIRMTFPESDKAILDRLIATGLTRREALGSIDATDEIAQRCNVRLPKSERIRFPLPAGFSSVSELIWEWLRQGWRYRIERNSHMRKHKKAYWDQTVFEMSVIEPKDFLDYFAMLSECVRWAKDNGIPVGPARGSAAASVVCYLLRITEVDPLQFPTMMFERFIDVLREDLPDVDLDFADDRRDEVRQHLVELYGADHVGNIANFTRYRGKNSVDDVSRVYRIPTWEAKTVKDLIIERSGGDSRFDASLEDTFTMFPNAKDVLDRYPELWNAVRLEGNYKTMGVHAAGIVVSNLPITETCALYHKEDIGKEKKTIESIAYDKKDADYLGMLKADFLGLKTMGMISRCLSLINMSLDELYQVPLDDPKTIASFRRGDVRGIFQFEGRATRLMTLDVQPSTFMEIADINALSRPGPLFSGASATYVDVKHGRRKAEHLHPIVDKYTYHSQYQIIYQEQVLKILQVMGGFPGSATGALRKIISLKLGEAQFNEWYGDFIAGAKEHHGVEPELADKIWRLMVTSATYSFNIAHCISYGMLAFWAMWLKVHHTKAFYAAQLSKIEPEKWPPLIKDAEAHGIDIRPPDIGICGVTWDPHEADDAVVAGFLQVPGVAEGRMEAISEWMSTTPKPREEWTWHDLVAVKGIGVKTIEKIERWASSDDPFKLYYAQRVLGELREYLAKNRYAASMRPNYTSDDIPRDADNLRVCWMGIVKDREYKDYIEDERARSGGTAEEIQKTMKSPDLVKGCVLKCYDDGEEDVYLRFNRFHFPAFKDRLEEVRTDGTHVVIVEGIKRKGFGINIQVKRLQLIDVTPVEEDELEEEAS